MKCGWTWIILCTLLVGFLGVLFVSTWAGESWADAREEEETEVSMADVPEPVKAIMLDAAGGKEIVEVEMSPRGRARIYEAEWMDGEMEVEVQVLYFCKLVGRSMELADDPESDDEENGDDVTEYHERDVSFNQVPAAVREAIAREAGKHRVHEIEEIISNKGTLYEAEWFARGWETEILVDSDGKLLEKHMELLLDDDDEDDDD